MAEINWTERTLILAELIDKFKGGFDPKKEYRPTRNSKRFLPRSQQNAVGKAFNIATDMIEKKAPKKDMVRITKWLLVTIYGLKYRLDYHKAYEDLDICQLSRKYGTKQYY